MSGFPHVDVTKGELIAAGAFVLAGIGYIVLIVFIILGN